MPFRDPDAEVNSRTIDGVWYPGTEYVENVVTLSVPVLFPNYDVLEPDFQYLGGEQGRGLLASSLARPEPYFGVDRFPSIAEKAAALIWSITLNHPFNDGNKRTGLTTSFAFLANNNQVLIAHQDEAVELCLRIAARTPGYTEAYVSRWINEHVVPVEAIGGILSGQKSPETQRDLWIQRRLEELPTDYHNAWIAFYWLIIASWGTE